MTTTFMGLRFYDDLEHIRAAHLDFLRGYLKEEIEKDLLSSELAETEAAEKEDTAAT